MELASQKTASKVGDFEEAEIMRMRSGVLLVAVAGLLSSATLARADHCGAAGYSCTSQPVSECQTSFTCQQGCGRTCYKLVYDTVLEKKWQTCYKTVCETVPKMVCKTCYREECKTVCKPCYVTEYKECKFNVCERVPVTCMKECCEVVCKPVQEVHCHKCCHQVCKTIQEQKCQEVCEKVCKPVTEKHCHKACHQVCKCVQETVMKTVCCTEMKECQETRYKCCKHKEWKQYCYNKSVKHKCGEWVTEQVCVPHKVRYVEECRDVCFDPCTCQTHCKRWHKCKSWCGEGQAEVKCKKVWKTKCWYEQVPCTKWVKETKHERIPYTVCVQVPHKIVKQVPVTCSRQVCGAYVDEKGVAHDCEGPGRKFVEGAQICTEVCCETCKMVTEFVKKQVPYTVCRKVCGAYVDEKGVGHDEEGPGRKFVEGAQVCRDVCETTTRMVQETVRKQVPVTTYQTVNKVCVKQVPVRVRKNVETTVRCRVPYKVQVCEQCVVKRRVKECVEVCVPKRVCRRVPVTVCEQCPPVCGKPCGPVCCEPSCPTSCKPSCPTTCVESCPSKCCEQPCCKQAPCCHKECRVRCEERTSLLERLFGRFGCGHKPCCGD
jgi:hypothetical protein